MRKREDIAAEFERTQQDYYQVLRKFRDVAAEIAAHSALHGVAPAEVRDRVGNIKREMVRLHVKLLRLRADHLELSLAEETGLGDLEVPDFLPEEL